jgi:hypothetical protein
MRYLTENIRYEIASYGRYKVVDTYNKVSVIVPSYVIDDCDAEDSESLEICMSRLRLEYAKKDEPRYNVEVVINRNATGGMANTMYWTGDGCQCDPLPYRDAWTADEAIEEISAANGCYMDAWTEEVKPFIC